MSTRCRDCPPINLASPHPPISISRPATLALIAQCQPPRPIPATPDQLAARQHSSLQQLDWPTACHADSEYRALLRHLASPAGGERARDPTRNGDTESERDRDEGNPPGWFAKLPQQQRARFIAQGNNIVYRGFPAEGSSQVGRPKQPPISNHCSAPQGSAGGTPRGHEDNGGACAPFLLAGHDRRGKELRESVRQMPEGQGSPQNTANSANAQSRSFMVDGGL